LTALVAPTWDADVLLLHTWARKRCARSRKGSQLGPQATVAPTGAVPSTLPHAAHPSPGSAPRGARAWPCRYLASASPCAAMTTCSFSASAFSTAATLRAPARPRQRPAAARACAADGMMQARAPRVAHDAHTSLGAACKPRVCRRPARVVRTRTYVSSLQPVRHVVHKCSTWLQESCMLSAVIVQCTGTCLRRCAALISFIAARTFRSGSMSARARWQQVRLAACTARRCPIEEIHTRTLSLPAAVQYRNSLLACYAATDVQSLARACDQRLDDGEAEGRHALGQLLLDRVRDLLLGLRARTGVSQPACTALCSASCTPDTSSATRRAAPGE